MIWPLSRRFTQSDLSRAGLSKPAAFSVPQICADLTLARSGLAPIRSCLILAGLRPVSILVLFKELLLGDRLFAHSGQFKQEVDNFVLEQRRSYGGQSGWIVTVVFPHALLLARHHPRLRDDRLRQLVVCNLDIVFLANLGEDQ